MIVVLMIFHIIVTIFMVSIILLQKGEDFGAESVSLRGAGGGESVFTKLTVIVGAIFMGDCLLMATLVRLESKVNKIKNIDEEKAKKTCLKRKSRKKIALFLYKIDKMGVKAIRRLDVQKKIL
ncbi:preprotein translocase subunit SecG [Holospora elegans E1]|uniref:Protein-export membrane protein SecG n=1 Tax=Holospora elegans E1 TaxID=1427503 RepID=A0A023DY70_9PROT|nr:preprotein translocase subunit SecG [Holospora elegans]GAJ46234.1 preprotein translocase subunit SecG [Holospora elegans E1]